MGDLTDPEDVEELVLAGFVPEEPEDGSVRLQGSRLDYMGRVEVYHNHQWGSVCGFQWDRADAEVVCRQMGYDTGRVIAVTRPEFGPANDIPVYYNYVDCDGSEERLADCYAKKNFSRDGKFIKIFKSTEIFEFVLVNFRSKNTFFLLEGPNFGQKIRFFIRGVNFLIMSFMAESLFSREQMIF